MFAAMDETVQEGPTGIYYVVAVAVTIADRVTAKKAALGVIGAPGRTRPFHWRTEGVKARNKMMGCLADVGAIAHVAIHFPTDRHKYAQARADDLEVIIPELVREGVSDLIIETRETAEDNRDRVVILNKLEEMKRSGAFAYDWLPKSEPTLWLADGVCGAVYGMLKGQTTYYEQLRRSGVIDQLIYLPQEMRQSRLPS